MIEVIPMSVTTIDWTVFLNILKKIFNRSLTTNLDTKKLAVGDLSSFIMILGGIRNPNADPLILLREAGPLLRHISAGFVVLGFNVDDLAYSTDLKIVKTEKLSVVSGNLEEWRTAIINCNKTVEQREFFNKCLSHFEKVGLGQLWSYYSKVDLNDATYKLESK